MSAKLKLFPRILWTRDFTYWWIVSLANVILFDVFWMMQTTFGPPQFPAFWPVLFLSATLLAIPSMFSRNGLFNAILLLAADLLFISNLMYCRTYFNAIPFNSYFLAGNLADFTASVADSFKWYYIFLPLLTILSYGFYLIRFRFRSRRPAWPPYLTLVILLGFLTWISDVWTGGTFRKMDRMRSSSHDGPSIAPVYSIPGFLIYDYFKSSQKKTEAEDKMVNDWLAFHDGLIQTARIDSVSSGSPARKNLVVVLCESLESWPIGKIIEGKEITPVLNRLIADSTTFYSPKVISQVGPGRSIDGQLLILAGLLPMRNNVYSYDAEDNVFFSLPKIVKESGGRSYLLTCDKPYVWNLANIARAFGIDTLISAGDFHNIEPVGNTRRLSDGGLMRQSVEKMKKGEVWPEGEQAFLMWVTYSGHNPFRLPEKLRNIDLDGTYPEIIKNYLITANYTDGAIGTLIDYLQSRSDWEDTMVVITGDHEGLASDRKEALSNPASADLVDSSPHTPLIILNAPKGGRYLGEMGQLDIYPTVLELMGWNSYPWKGLGFSVLDPDFPGIAIGSQDDLNGDAGSLEPGLVEHIKNARDVSDLILRYDLLKNL